MERNCFKQGLSDRILLRLKSNIDQYLMKQNIVFVGYREEFEIELITLWRKSLSQAIGVKEDTRPESVSEHLEFLRSLNPGCISVALEEPGPKLVGFMRLEGQVVRDLFIHVEHQRQGLGSQFVQQAKEENEVLSLSTFELNKGAQKFYEAMGFVIRSRGYASFDGNSWATNKEQLADITYEWRRNRQFE